MKKILAIGGSNSSNSINRKLANYAAAKIYNTETIVADLNDYVLPIYGIDLENKNGIPEKVTELNSLLESVDGFVISLAEHNGSYTVAFKNTFDWLSRIDKNVWKNKPMLLMATSPGGRGAATVLQTAKNTFPRLGAIVIADFSLPSFRDNFTDDGLTNKELDDELNSKIQLLQDAL